MPRRNSAVKRDVLPDPLHGDVPNRTMLGDQDFLLELVGRILAQFSLADCGPAVIDYLLPVTFDFDNFGLHHHSSSLSA